MKRNRLAFLFLLALLYSCISKDKDIKTESEENGLFGGVKSVTSKIYKDSSLIEHKKVYYDTSGFIKSIEYYLNDTIAKTDLIERDDNYRVAFKKTILPNGTSQTQTYKYGSNGLQKIVQKLNGTQNTVWVYENDEEGRKVKETVIIDEDVKSQVHYQYVNDSKTRVVSYNHKGDKASVVETYKTDTRVETKFETYITKDFISTAKIIVSLDTLGNPVKEKHFREGNETDVIKYWYDLDSKQNWIIKFTYSNEELVMTTERKIEYFKK